MGKWAEEGLSIFLSQSRTYPNLLHTNLQQILKNLVFKAKANRLSLKQSDKPFTNSSYKWNAYIVRNLFECVFIKNSSITIQTFFCNKCLLHSTTTTKKYNKVFGCLSTPDYFNLLFFLIFQQFPLFPRWYKQSLCKVYSLLIKQFRFSSP